MEARIDLRGIPPRQENDVMAYTLEDRLSAHKRIISAEKSSRSKVEAIKSTCQSMALLIHEGVISKQDVVDTVFDALREDSKFLSNIGIGSIYYFIYKGLKEGGVQ